eukprot:g4719.t1
MEGFLIELDEKNDFSNVLMRRYAMLESEVLILSGKVGESAERLCDLKDAKRETENVFSISTKKDKKRYFRTTSVEEWIECIVSSFASLSRKKEIEMTKAIIKKDSHTSSPTKTKVFSEQPSTPDLRRTLQQSLQDMKSAVIDAATTTTIPRYSIVSKPIQTDPKYLNAIENVRSEEDDIDRNKDLITLLLKKEEQIKRLQELGRRQRRQFRAARQKERKEILSELLRLKTLHEKRVQDLLQVNEDLTMEIRSKDSELDVCRSNIALSESRIEHLESRVAEMEKSSALKKKKRKKKKKKIVVSKENKTKNANLNKSSRRKASRVKML